MKKLLTLLTISPLALTACGGSTTELDRETHLGEGVEYLSIKVEGETNKREFSKDTFYQAARDYGWTYVQKWFNEELAKIEIENIKKDENNREVVKNYLSAFDMFDGADGEFSFEELKNVLAAELIFEEWQQYDVINKDSNFIPFHLTKAREGYTVTKLPDNMNTLTKTEQIGHLKTNFADYITKKINNDAGEMIMTMNYLMEQETITKYDGDKYRPSSRLQDIYNDNKPTEWFINKIEGKKMTHVKSAVENLTTPIDFTDTSDGAEKFDFSAINDGNNNADKNADEFVEFFSFYQGMGYSSKTYGAPSSVTSVVNSTNSNYRKEGWVNVGTDEEQEWITTSNDEDYFVHYVKPVDLEDMDDTPGNSKVDQLTAHKTDATTLSDATRLYAYFALAQVSSIKTFAKNYYYSKYDLEAFDEVIYDKLSSDLDN